MKYPKYILAIIILALAAAASSGAYFLYIKNPSFYIKNLSETGGDKKIACTMDAKQCPDGSYVSRTGPKCEFSTCPPPPLESSGIKGTVFLGPICPVQKNPPDPACADKPYKTNLAAVAAGTTNIVREFSSDSEGKFSVDLPPGEYEIISASAKNIFPRCAGSGKITVNGGQYAQITVNCDSGIR